MELNNTLIASIVGLLGIIVTTIGGVLIAGRTNRSEKATVAQQTLEQTRDEAYEARLALKDERIASLREDLENCKLDNKLKVEELEAELDRAHLEITKLRGQQN